MLKVILKSSWRLNVSLGKLLKSATVNGLLGKVDEEWLGAFRSATAVLLNMLNNSVSVEVSGVLSFIGGKVCMLIVFPEIKSVPQVTTHSVVVVRPAGQVAEEGVKATRCGQVLMGKVSLVPLANNVRRVANLAEVVAHRFVL